MSQWQQKKLSRRQLLQATGLSLCLPYVSRAQAQEKSLTLYARENFLPDETIKDFQKTIGVTVVQETYKTADEMVATMLSGKKNFDIVMQPGEMLPALVQAGVYAAIIHTEYPSWAELDPAVTKLAEAWDPRNQFMVPYLWGAIGMTYNADQVNERIPHADLTSLDLIFKQANAQQLAGCGITMLDSPTTVIPMALSYLGKNPNSTDPEDYQAVASLFHPIKPFIKEFDNSEFVKDLSNSTVCAANSWSSDRIAAIKRGKNAGIDVDLRFVVPKSGAPAWLLGWCVPKSSLAQAEAKLFLGYMLQAEVMAKVTNNTSLANASTKAKSLVKPEIANDPAIYMDDETMKHLWALRPVNPEQLKTMQALWQKIKNG